MSVLSAEDFAARLTQFVGDDTSEEAMNFMADSLDTVKTLYEKQGISEETVKQKLAENDEQWRKRFMNRFYQGVSGVPGNISPVNEKSEPAPTAETVGFSDLFK